MAYKNLDGWQAHDDAGRRKYLNSSERERFLAAADRYAPHLRALCHLLAFTGCRISEALALTAHQLDREEHTITFRTLKQRRSKFRTLPVPEALTAMLLALLATDDGRFWGMHRGTAWQYVKTILRDADVTGPMASPRGLRHGFGMRAVARQVPLTLVQQWLGHSSLETTAIYLAAVGPEAREFARRIW